MAVQKLNSGKWQVIISYRDKSGITKKKKKSFKTNREAKNFETDYLRTLKEVEDLAYTYQDVMDTYIKWNKLSANERSVKDNIFLLDKFTSHLRSKTYIKIRRKDFTDIYLTISNENWSITRKNRAVKQIKAVSRFAYNHLDLDDRTKHLEPFKRNSDELHEMQVWTPDELNQFLGHVENYSLSTLFWFQYYTGLRVGETRALLKSDVIDNHVSVNKSIRSHREGFKPLKNTSSKRVITLDAETLNRIEPLLQTDGDFLFGELEPVSENMVQRTFKKALKNANVPKIKVHDLRHSHASLLINKGANIVAVSRRLGHSDIQTTLRTYTHLFQESDDELICILDKTKK